MQNESFEFTFYDKSGLDEKSFFLFFMPHLSRPEEKPKGMSPIIEAAIAGFRGDKEPPSCKNEYSSTPDTFYSATYNRATGGLEVNVLTTTDDPNAKPGTLHIRSHEGDTTTVAKVWMASCDTSLWRAMHGTCSTDMRPSTKSSALSTLTEGIPY